MKNRIQADHENQNHAESKTVSGGEEPHEGLGGDIVEARRSLEGYVRGNPLASLGAALCLGVFIGWIMKSR